MTAWTRKLATVAAALLLASPVFSGTAAASGGLDPAITRSLDAAIDNALRIGNIPGAIIGVWSPEGDYVHAAGVADRSSGAAMQSDFYSRIGSETKTFTVTAVLQLVEEGRIGLDDPIGDYLSGVPGGDVITVRQLAGMQSGLANYTETDAFAQAITGDPRQQHAPQDLLGWAFAEPAAFPPGQRYQYSNTNTILLGLLVEKISGQSLADYLHNHILAPLGMWHTSFPSGAEFPDPHPQGYTKFGDDGTTVVATNWNPSFAWSAGAMISTLEDLHTWVPAVATGALLSPATQQQRLRFVDDDGRVADDGYGLGIFNLAGWIGHNGSLPGYQTVAVYLPQRQMTLVVLTNTDVSSPDGAEPSAVLANAVTSVVAPDHLYPLNP